MDDSAVLRARIIDSLCGQGFRFRDGRLVPPDASDKAAIRASHLAAVQHRIERARAALARKEGELLSRIADGSEVDPARIVPRLVEVVRGSGDELLFRYATLHWSLPVSSGYGRRLRFLVIDESNGKLIGLIGLADPVYALSARDVWIGWSSQARRRRLKNVMDVFVLGAVPPYSFLLCGKLVAMLVASDAVRLAFARKYGGLRSLIAGDCHDGLLALVTTMSRFGRSSPYNRLRFRDRLLYVSVGFTRGYGEFQFSDALYAQILDFVMRNSAPTAKHRLWGRGFRNRREVVRKRLKLLGLPYDLSCHGVNREVFVVPLARNAREFLRGEDGDLCWFGVSEGELFDYFRDRWLLRRAAWDGRYRDFRRESFRLWGGA